MFPQIKNIRVGPITVDRFYDRKRQCYVNRVHVGRITVTTMSEVEAARNELSLANTVTSAAE